MENYSQTEIEALIWNTSFRQWIINPTPELDVYWNRYLQQNPDKVLVFIQAKEAVQALQVKQQPISEEEMLQTIGKTMQAARQNKRADKLKSAHALWYKNTWIRVAASVIICIAIGWGVYTHFVPGSTQITYQQLISTAKENLVEKVNTSGQPLTLRLADGSVVVLQKDSRISYNPAFKGAQRKVYLSGEAFFEVVKDPGRPFFVYANELVTRVLGTSFKVRSYETDAQASVEVRTGKVSVYAESVQNIEVKAAQHEPKEVVLTPNQKIVFSRKEVRMDKSLVDKPVVTAPAAHAISFEYEDAPVTAVFTDLEKAFSVEIVYDKKIMRNCPLTASLTDEFLFEKLDIICKAIEARYEVVDGKIIIYGKGCKN